MIEINRGRGGGHGVVGLRSCRGSHGEKKRRELEPISQYHETVKEFYFIAH